MSEEKAAKPAVKASEPVTKEQIAAWQQKRVADCSKYLSELLEEYDCTLAAIPQIVNGQIVAQVQLVAK